MRKIILFVGVLLFLLMTIPSYAQKTSEKQKESKTEKVQKKKTQKFKRLKRFSETKSIGLPTISSPTNNSRVSSPLSIEGIASKNRQVKVNVEATFTGGSQDLGTFVVNCNSSGEWTTTPINLWVPEDAKNVKFQISATQTINNKKSESIIVTVLPPQEVMTVTRAKINGEMKAQLNPKVASKKVAQKVSLKPKINPAIIESMALPTITSPNDQTVITTPLIVEGTAQKRSTITVTIKSNIAKPNFNSKSIRTKADENGKWKTAPINLWLFEDATDARFKITATEKIPRIDNPRLSKAITVIPSINQNFPRHPIKPWGVSFRPKDGKNVVSPMVIKGSAGNERTVQIVISSRYIDSKGQRVDLPRINTSTTSDRKGKWVTSPIVLPTPQTESQLTHIVKVNQIGIGRVSGNVNYKVTSDPNQVVPPVVTFPIVNNSGIKNYTVVKGTGIPHRYVEVKAIELWNSLTNTTGTGSVLWPNRDGYEKTSIGTYRAKVDADGKWKTQKINLARDATSGVDPDNIGYRFEAVQIFHQYDNKKNDGTYPEIKSEEDAVQGHQAKNF